MADTSDRSWEKYTIVGPYVTLFCLLVVFTAVSLALAAPTSTALGWRAGSLGYGVTATIFAAVLMGVLIVLPMRSHIHFLEGLSDEREQALREEAQRQEFEARLHRALESADSEPEAQGVVARALAQATPDTTWELLVADSSRAHLVRSAHGGPWGDGAGCPVDSPWGCQAVRRGQTSVYASADELDACPKLRDRPSGNCSAICVPVTIMGRAMGVLHSTGPVDTAPSSEHVARLECVAMEAGSRIAMLRAMERSQLQASTDPLTGLLNRRSLEQRVRKIRLDGRPFSLVLADLDHFKQLNDTYGHETGDRSLRVFARAMLGAVRPGDLVCRFGGEEFVLVLPDCAADDAVIVAERVRTLLAAALASATLPTFSATFGVSDTAHCTSLVGLLQLADSALRTAKQGGRNAILVSREFAEPGVEDHLLVDDETDIGMTDRLPWDMTAPASSGP